MAGRGVAWPQRILFLDLGVARWRPTTGRCRRDQLADRNLFLPVIFCLLFRKTTAGEQKLAPFRNGSRCSCSCFIHVFYGRCWPFCVPSARASGGDRIHTRSCRTHLWRAGSRLDVCASFARGCRRQHSRKPERVFCAECGAARTGAPNFHAHRISSSYLSFPNAVHFSSATRRRRQKQLWTSARSFLDRRLRQRLANRPDVVGTHLQRKTTT